MARGPFSPIEQPDIVAPDLRPEALPTSATAAGAGVFDAVAKGVQAGGALLAQRQAKAVKEDLTTNLDAIEQAMHAASSPEALKAIFDGAAEGNPFFKKAKEEFVLIANAVKEGKLPGDFAVTRTKSALRDAIKDAPEFEQELQQAAKTALGFSPEAEAFQNVLRSFGRSKQEQTPGQKAIENLVSLGVDRDTAHGLVLKRTMQEFEAQDIKVRMERGELQANEIGMLAGIEAEKLTGTVFSSVLADMQNNGGVFNPESAKAQAAANLQAIRAQALQSLPASAPLTVRTTINNQLDEAHKRMVEMIDGGAMKKMFETHTDTMAAVMKERGFQMFPFLRSISAIGGDEAALQALSLFGQYRTEQQRGVVRQVNPMFGAFETLGSLATAMQGGADALANGNPIGDLTPEQRKAIAALDAHIIIAPSTEGPARKSKSEAWDRLKENVGDRHMLKLLKDPRTMREVKTDSALQARTKGILEAGVDTISAGMAALSQADKDALSVRDGRLTIDPTKLLNLQSQGVQGVSATAKRMVEDVNLLLDLDASYSKVVGAELGITADDMLKGGINAPQTTTQQDTRPTRRRWDADAGTFIDVSGE